MQWSCKLFFEFQVLLILFLSLVQVQGEYIFKEIESTFALFDRTKRKSSLKVYQSLCRSYTYDIREWNDFHSSPERRELFNVNRKIKLFRVRMPLHCK